MTTKSALLFLLSSAAPASASTASLCPPGYTGHRPTRDCRGFVYCSSGTVMGGDSDNGGVIDCWPNQLYDQASGLCVPWHSGVDTSLCPDYNGSTIVGAVDENANQERFFCGVTASDAATVCRPCPGGTRDECDDPSHNCFANIIGCEGAEPAPSRGMVGGNPNAVCGATYAEAESNCMYATKCPSGDGCASGQTCFDIPGCAARDAAPAVALATTASDVHMVCGTDYDNAAMNCAANTYGCHDGNECPDGTACFEVQFGDCVATASAPLMDSAPGNSGNANGNANGNAHLSVCGSSYNDAVNQCRVGKQCPNGDGCGVGQNCYDLPPGSCPEEAAVSEPIALEVCGTNYGDAATNCRSNPMCINGDSCPEDMMCYNIPKPVCDAMDEAQAMPAAEPAAEPATEPAAEPAAEPVGFVPLTGMKQDIPPPEHAQSQAEPQVEDDASSGMSVCGNSYNHAVNNCSRNKKCPLGDGCPGNQGCYDLPAGTCVEPANAEPDLLMVCGYDYGDAEGNCRTNPRCENGGCANNEMGCYAIPSSISTCLAPEQAQAQAQADDPAPIAAMKQDDLDEEADASMEPTSVCGNSWNDAVKKCRTNRQCPSGDGCPGGQTCYDLPPGTCVAPVEATPENIMVCGESYDDARTNCRTNVACPEGDPNDCATGNCFAIPADMCLEEESVQAVEPEVAFSTEDTSNGPPGLAKAPGLSTPAPTPKRTPFPTIDYDMVCGDTYGDAVDNCRTNQKCESGDGCTDGKTCYALTPGTCPPEGSPTKNPTQRPTTPKPTLPTTMNVCGDDYADAMANICTNAHCPSPGCPNDKCFSLPYTDCSEANVGGLTLTGNKPDTAAQSVVTPSPTESPTISKAPVTASPSKSPVYNIFFCGETYQLAEENCWDAEPCPSGTGCTKPGESCFGISTEKCHSKEPTLSPTTSMPTTSPTPKPTQSPVENTYFCGNSFAQASRFCSAETACPGLVCPNGMQCFAGIECNPDAAPAEPVVERYCGLSMEDASNRCATNAIACPDGLSDGCAWQESCFELPDGCGGSDGDVDAMGAPDMSGGSDAPGNSDSAAQNTPAAQNASGNADQPWINYTSFCGKNYNDAANNCNTKTPCPYHNECEDGEMCYPIGRCEVASSAALNVGEISMTADTLPPTPGPTARPTWNINYVLMAENGAVGSRSIGLMTKSLALAAFMVALAL